MVVAAVSPFLRTDQSTISSDQIQFPLAILTVACITASFNGVGIHQWRLELAENVKYQIDGLFVSGNNIDPAITS
jgi:hypothetical protein